MNEPHAIIAWASERLTMGHQADNSEDENAKTLKSASRSELVPTATCPNCALVVPVNTRFCPNDGTPINTSEQGRAIPSYEFIKLLGSGGMGDVYEAEHLVLKKRVAIKTLKPHLLETSAFQRFQTEARAASSLKHANIVSVYDCGVSQNGEPFMVMDLVQGETLAQVLKRKGSLSVDESVDIVMQICAGVNCAHEKGILHRDLKPSNVILEEHGQTKIARVLDFGIAKILEGDESVSQMTRTGELMGTPSYMSPEQINGEKLDQRSDVYAVGCIFYEMLAGSAPILGKTVMETMLRQVTEVPMPLSQAALKPFPDQLETIVARALAKDPTKRFATLREMQTAIENYKLGQKQVLSQPNRPLITKNRMIIAGVLIFNSLVCLAWYLANQSSDDLQPSQPKPPVPVPSATEKPVTAKLPTMYRDGSADQLFIAFVRKHARDTQIEVGKLGDANEFTDISDQGLASLSNYYQLRILNLRDCLNITAEGLKSIAHLPNLVVLELADTNLGDDALKVIAKMHLQRINLARTRFTNQGLLVLKDNDSFIDVNLKGTQISDEGLKCIATFKRLRVLTLDECMALTDRGIAEISRLGLESLRLTDTHITDGAVKQFLKMKELRDLTVSKTQLDDAALMQLAKLKTLKSLDIRECSAISKESIAKFRKLSPHCVVYD